MAEPQRFRFKPRYRGLAFGAAGLGTALTGISILALGAAMLPLATGAAGMVLGAAYLLSPTWRLEVVVGDDALEVKSKSATKLHLAWGDVKRVVMSTTVPAMFVDGGAPAQSLLVPDDGAPAPYDIDDKPGLCAAILAHVDPAKVTKVERLDTTSKS